MIHSEGAQCLCCLGTVAAAPGGVSAVALEPPPCPSPAGTHGAVRKGSRLSHLGAPDVIHGLYFVRGHRDLRAVVLAAVAAAARNLPGFRGCRRSYQTQEFATKIIEQVS